MEDQTIDFNLRLLSLDLALKNTGYCLYEVSTGKWNFKISSLGLIETEAKAQTSQRLSFLINRIKDLIVHNDVNYVIIEKPPMALFGGRKTLFGTLSLFSAFYYLIGYLDATGMYYREIEPSQWQGIAFRKIETFKNLKKEYAKQLSIKNASFILEYLKKGRQLRSSDEHVADAINIGSVCISKLSSKEWELPDSIKHAREEHLQV